MAAANSGGGNNNDFSHDVFICHDHRDLDYMTRPLSDALKKKGFKPWLYEESMKWEGINDIHQGLHIGILNSKGSVIIVTHNFLKNDSYARLELGMIFNKKVILKNKLIFAIWDYGIKPRDVALYDLELAGQDAIPWEKGVDEVSNELINRINGGFPNG